MQQRSIRRGHPRRSKTSATESAIDPHCAFALIAVFAFNSAAMNYVPQIKSANPKNHFELGPYSAVLLGDIESLGSVEYKFIMVVYDENQKPCYFVASEVNDMADKFGGGSHFLGLFDGNGHANRGTSNDWADEAKFTDEALRIIRKKFPID